MFSQEPRCHYQKSQLAEVICQLRFPDILTIQANVPVDFQEAIRDTFPIFTQRTELPENNPTNNYQFATADGAWRINLTSKFISLSCSRYTCWEDFAGMLDKPLVAFIKIYRPALFSRVGLRYLNFFSRRELNLEGTPYRELFQPSYLGILGDEQVPESATTQCCTDAQLNLSGGGKCKLHAGPGLVKRNGQADQEIKFIFDMDLFMAGNIPVNHSAGALQTLHTQAFPIFRGAITDTLHKALEPERI